MHVNLLPAELVAKSRLIRSLRNWGIAIALWLLTLVAINVPQGWKTFQVYRELKQLHADVGPLRLKEGKTQQLRSITSDLKRRSQRIQMVLPPNRIPSLLGIFGKTFQASESPIALQDFLVSIQDQTKTNGTTPGNSSPAPEKPAGLFSTQIIARGYTSANPSVAEVIKRLEEYGVFQTVLLRSTRDSVVANQQVDEFELECDYVE